jgi:predicted small lipoprotein YifL
VLKIGCKSICILLLGSVLLLTGCGQKGNLSLVDSSSQTVTNSAKVPDSNAYPQDVAFATIDDDDPNNY